MILLNRLHLMLENIIFELLEVKKGYLTSIVKIFKF